MNFSTKIHQTSTAKLKRLSPPVLALALVGVIGSLGMVDAAHAVPYQTGFEAPTFANGGSLLGVDGWSTAIPPFLNPSAATITNTIARRGLQSVKVPGADLISFPETLPAFDAVGSYRHPVDLTISAPNQIAHVDADLMLTTNRLQTPADFFALTIAARNGNGETIGEIGLNSQGVVQTAKFNEQPGDNYSPVFKKPIRFNKWYHITMLIAFNDRARTTSYFIDDHFLGSIGHFHFPGTIAVPPDPLSDCRSNAISTSNTLLRGAMVVYARPDGDATGGAGNSRTNYTARFDNFRISVHKDAPDVD